MAWEPKKLNPTHYRVLALHWHGLSNQEIAVEVGIAAEHVCAIITSDLGREVIEELGKRTLDTIADVQATLQAYAPMALEAKVALLSAKDERVRNIAASDILAMAGHQPVKRVVIEKPTEEEDTYRDKSLEEMREAVLAKLGLTTPQPDPPPAPPTVH